MKDKVIYPDESFSIIGAALEVHKTIGCGFTEPIYQDAFEIELQERGIPYQREKPIYANYHGHQLKTEFVPDFICFDNIIVELKAVKDLEDYHRAQAINYARLPRPT